MLPLDSPHWSELTYAGGSAAHIPASLALLASPEAFARQPAEVDEFLWGDLCHQGTVYTGTYAALPHIAAIAADKPPPEQVKLLIFIGNAAIQEQTGHYEAIPADLQSGYAEGLRQAARLIVQRLAEDWPAEEHQYLLGALAAVRGHPQLGAGVMHLTSELECPQCAARFLAAGYNRFADQTVLEEGVREFAETDGALLLEWLASHPLGLVVEIAQDSTAMTPRRHLATCPTLRAAPAVPLALRLGAPDMPLLLYWAYLHGMQWRTEPCPVCKPSPYQ